MENELIIALTLGLVGGMIPGPVLTAIFTEILQSNFIKSFRIILIALFIETIVALTSLVVLSSLNLSESVFRGISIIGAIILTWIAFSLWKIKKIDSDEKLYFGFWKLSAMILSNGVLWTFWVTICIPKAIILTKSMILGDYIFLALVEVGWLITTTLVAFIFSRFREILSKPKIIPIVFKVLALTFIYFAVDMTVQSISYFINN